MRVTLKTLVRVLGASAGSLAAVGMLAMLGASPASANGSGAGIANSPHDFSTETWNFRGEICRVCHVPHDHGRTTGMIEQGLLWNHRLSVATYEMYSSPTLTGAQDAQPGGISKLCLGCHDNTVGMAQFDANLDGTRSDGQGGTIGIGPLMEDIDSGFIIGGFTNPTTGAPNSLAATHPLSIVYDVADGGLNPTNTNMGTSGTIDDVLDGGKIQCSSCHDVHDGPEAVPGTHLLRVGNKASQGGAAPSELCLTCHIK